MKTVIAGFDAFDPQIFEDLHDQGQLPHLSGLLAEGGYRRFKVASPPQSEVSWTSIATGLNPGGHGIFDFVHRSPEGYGLQVSLLPTQSGPLGTRFVPPHDARTLFDQAVDDGYPATVMWWPATFPARLESPVHTIPGLGAPDIRGRLGVGTSFTPAGDRPPETIKTPWEPLEPRGRDLYRGHLPGPASKKGPAVIDLQLQLLDDHGARLELAGLPPLDLQEGRWSPIVELSFKMGLFVRVRALTRFILTQARPAPRLYALPLQPHPVRAPWPFAAPPGFIKAVWKQDGPFLTIGWPQDTTALEDGLIDDEQFLALCESIFAVRRQIFFHQLERYEEGILAAVFDTLDRVQHMFRRDRPDIVEDWYRKMDAFAGELLARTPPDANLLVLSDHGFASFDHKVHINRWLLDQGYLASRDPASGAFRTIDWGRTRAYGLGLNSLYINQVGRESAGVVGPDEHDGLIRELQAGLSAWAVAGQQVFSNVLTRDQAFEGSLARHGPDLVLGYAPGFRASQESGLGGWGDLAVAPNRDHWGADHCIDAEAVAGVIFARRGLSNLAAPSFRDFPSLALGADFRPREGRGGISSPAQEEEDAVEERLKGLGYL